MGVGEPRAGTEGSSTPKQLRQPDSLCPALSLPARQPHQHASTPDATPALQPPMGQPVLHPTRPTCSVCLCQRRLTSCARCSFCCDSWFFCASLRSVSSRSTLLVYSFTACTQAGAGTAGDKEAGLRREHAGQVAGTQGSGSGAAGDVWGGGATCGGCFCLQVLASSRGQHAAVPSLPRQAHATQHSTTQYDHPHPALAAALPDTPPRSTTTLTQPSLQRPPTMS